MGKIWKHTFKVAVVLATSVIAIPYTVAILANMLMGWPQRDDKYRRALHPKKVYNLNYALLLQLTKLKYVGMWGRWKRFYNTASPTRLIKDIPYGMNENALDVYMPHDEWGHSVEGVKPVLVFLYGGTWSSGDKDMYSLLCAQLADRAKAVVCCPNYSLYPKGFVDDMVQDVVDCLTWIHHNIHEYGGQSERVMLIGHSAGAHLCVMATLELVMKRLLHNPQSIIMTPREVERITSMTLSRQSSAITDTFQFEEGHFDSNSSNGEEAASTSDVSLARIASNAGSFYVVEPKEGKEPQSNMDSFYMVDSGDERRSKDPSREASVSDVTETKANISDDDEEEKEEEREEEENKEVTDENRKPEIDTDREKEVEEIKEVETGERAEESRPETEGADSKVVPEIKEEDMEEEDTEEQEDDDDLSTSQREIRDILSSIKLVVGLAGIYHIGDHYAFESWRGVEDVSPMGRAMYGPDHFDRFSPTCIVEKLPRNTRLPALCLIHGDVDNTVPLTSPTRFLETMADMGCSSSSYLQVVPHCGHYDICLDLMEPSRPHYNAVMTTLLQAANQFL